MIRLLYSCLISLFQGLFRPPLLVMLFLTAVLLIGLFYAAEKGLDYLQTAYYVQDIQTAEPEKVPSIAQKLSDQQLGGLKALVQGMNSSRECVAAACSEALKEQIENWKSLSREQAALYYNCLLDEFLKQTNQFGPTALKKAAELSGKIEQEIILLGLPGQMDIGLKSRRVITYWESTLPKSNMPVIEGRQYPLLVLGGLPESQPSSAQKREITRKRAVGESRETVSADPSQNLAHSDDISPFLNEKLFKISPDAMEMLPTQDLMRLLNHPVWEIVQTAENILRERDSFQNQHLDLANSLYHPQSQVRISLLRKLKQARNLELSTWLTELLHDPDAEVRYETAVAICQEEFQLDDYQPFFEIIHADGSPRIADLVGPVEAPVMARPLQQNPL